MDNMSRHIRFPESFPTYLSYGVPFNRPIRNFQRIYSFLKIFAVEGNLSNSNTTWSCSALFGTKLKPHFLPRAVNPIIPSRNISTVPDAKLDPWSLPLNFSITQVLPLPHRNQHLKTDMIMTTIIVFATNNLWLALYHQVLKKILSIFSARSQCNCISLREQKTLALGRIRRVLKFITLFSERACMRDRLVTLFFIQLNSRWPS